MKNILTTLLVLLSVVSFSQTKVQLEVENKNGTEEYKLKLEREVDGKTVITEKTYSSKEEMKNDPELKDLDLHFMEGHGTSFKSKDGNMLIEIDENVKDGDHKIMFISKEGGEGEKVEMKVWVDEDGKKHVMKNGVEIDMDELLKEGDHKMMFISEDGEGETKIEVIIDEDGTKHVLKNGKKVELAELHEGGDNVFVFKTDGDHEFIEEKVEVEVTVDKDGNHHVKVNGEEMDYEEWKENNEMHMGTKSMMWVEDGEDGKQIKKEIIIIKKDGESKEGVKVEVIVSHIVLHLEEINDEDAKAFSLENSKELKMDEFNFYPNPSNGTFQLKFQGKDRPTMVKVMDINGKEMYGEDLQDFNGSYDKEINLSGLKKGIYLLQVVQGTKAVNKKIVIE